MKKVTLLFCSLLLFASSNAQQQVKKYQMMNLMYVKPIHGHEKQFEAAVMAHNSKFHANAPYTARLAQVTDGSGSDGWYVWTMGPLMYSDIDGQPDGKPDHDADWQKNVDPHIEKYGESSFWKFQEDMSFTPPNYNPDRIDVWMIDLKQGKKMQFNDLLTKWKTVWTEKKYPFSFRVFYNDLWNASGKDVGIVFSFTKYADFDQDISWRNDYEAKYGPGSWDSFWTVWNDCVVSVDEQLRKFVK